MIDPQKHPGKERKRWLLAGYWMLGSEILIEFEKIPYSSHKQLVPIKSSPSGPPNPSKFGSQEEGDKICYMSCVMM